MASVTAAQKAEAQKQVELEKQMKAPPSWRALVLLYPFMVLADHWILDSTLAQSAAKIAFIGALVYLTDYAIYRYRTRKEK